MSQENVEATKRAVAALNRGDYGGVEELYSTDAVVQDLQNAPDQPVTAEGGQAIRQNLKLWAAAFDELRVDIEEYIDGPNAVICARIGRGRARRAASRSMSTSSTSTSSATEGLSERSSASDPRTKPSKPPGCRSRRCRRRTWRQSSVPTRRGTRRGSMRFWSLGRRTLSGDPFRRPRLPRPDAW